MFLENLEMSKVYRKTMKNFTHLPYQEWTKLITFPFWCFRSVGYLYVFPQFLEGYSFSPESANEVVVEKGLRQVTTHLEILENNYLEKSRYLTGSKVTVADTCAASVLVLLEWTGFSFKMWPKVDSWLTRVKQQMFWDEVHTTHNDFVGELERANLVQRWCRWWVSWRGVAIIHWIYDYIYVMCINNEKLM